MDGTVDRCDVRCRPNAARLPLATMREPIPALASPVNRNPPGPLSPSRFASAAVTIALSAVLLALPSPPNSMATALASCWVRNEEVVAAGASAARDSASRNRTSRGGGGNETFGEVENIVDWIVRHAFVNLSIPG